MKCPFCGNEFQNLEQHLEDWHFLKIQDYYEMDPIRPEDERCCKCGSFRFPLTYIEPSGFFLPHWNCLRSYEKAQYIKSVREAMQGFYNRVGSDRFLQMFLISDVYFSATFSHTYEEFKGVLKKLQKPERNKIWFLDWLPGFPKTFHQDNIGGIKVIPIDEYYKFKSSSDRIEVNDIVVNFADIVPFDFRHHSRYNLFNQSPNARQVRRLRLKDDKDRCIKFEPLDDSPAFSIFKLERAGQRIKPSDLGELDLLVVKLLILRNKNFMKLIQTVFGELIQNASVVSDSVFLKNTVSLGQTKGSNIQLLWTPELVKENFINISIL